MHPPDGPPVCTALNFLLFGMPPPISYIISRSVMPIGTSTRPVLFTLPTSEKILVPVLPAVPIELNHSAPLIIIRGTLAHVSTLFRFVGLFHKPLTDVWAYFGLGAPTLPSNEDMRALDSPETKAPAPLYISTSKSKPEPMMSFPRSPCSLACSSAMPVFSTANGYSSRTYM